MATLDKRGWLPLHNALREKVSLGTIKLLVKGNPSALRVADRQLLFPFHVACQFSTLDIVQHLVKLGDDSLLNHCDVKGNYPLHYACRGANYKVVTYLMNANAQVVSERNQDGKLPMHLLCECEQDEVNSKSAEYVETICCLLLAYPETVMG